jgi:hypothetical protein
VVTNASGEWSISLPIGSSICVLYVSGAPSTVLLTATTNLPPSASRRDIYEYQITGYNCLHNTQNPPCYLESQSYDRAVDSGYDMVFTLQKPYIPPTPTPVPAATPVPKASSAPTSAPVVTAQPKSNGAPVVVTPKPATTSQPAAVATDTQAPSVPGNFRVASTKTNALVNANWDASADNVGVVNYELDRSLNGSDWAPVIHTLDRPGYEDTEVAYGLTYTYRVRALDAKGNTSEYAIGQVRTPEFVQNTSTDTALTYTSDDSAATVLAPAGSFAKDAQCSVELGGYNALKLDSGSAIMAGPYQLICKDSQGDIITKFVHAVTWTVTPRTSDLKLSTPQAYTVGADGRPVAFGKGSAYDSKAKSYKFTQTTNDRVIVLAAQQSSPTVVIFIVVVVVVILLIALGTFLSLQRKRIAGYKDYLRDKYYNL